MIKKQKYKEIRKNNLRELRKSRGYESPAEFGKLIGMSATHVGRLENCTRGFTLDVLTDISRVLKASFEEILDLPMHSVKKRGVEESVMNLAIGAISDSCDRHKVAADTKQMSKWVTELYNDIVGLNLDLHQIKLKGEMLVKPSGKSGK
jgi:transcriptional regulator with XRE-family HTH domain